MAVGVLKEVSRWGLIEAVVGLRVCVVGAVVWGVAPGAASGVVGSSGSLSGSGAISVRLGAGSGPR